MDSRITRTIYHAAEWVCRCASGSDEFRAEVAENWLSITEEDAAQLCRIRPRTSDLPIVCQLAILDCMKKGETQVSIARRYRVTSETVHLIKKRGITSATYQLPRGFELLTQMASTHSPI